MAFGPGGMLAATSLAFGPDSTLAVAFADGQICLRHLSP
jgi:hypothetical protein